MVDEKQKYLDLLRAAQEVSVVEWIEQNGIVNERGSPIEFREHMFLLDIYDDWTPVQAIPKAAQIGFSTLAILKTIYASLKRQYNVIYTLPTVGDANQFVSEKVNRMITLNPSISKYIKNKDSVEQKQVGDRFIYYRGTFTEKAALMFSSDLNVYDEEDRSDATVIDQYESRLQYSKYRGQWHLSNLSFPNVGVHKHWLQSDQKHWFITCPHCNEMQYMDWDKNVDREREIYICSKCHKELSDDDRRVGEWVAKWEGKDISGYWINQMMACWIPCKDLLKTERDKSKDYFYNFCLGLPYVGSEVVVDKDLVLKNTTTLESTRKDVCIGVDVGKEKHVVVGTPYGIFRVFKTTEWDEVIAEFLKYDAVMVIDAMPDITIPRMLMEKYRGRVFINYFVGDRRGKDPEEFKKDKEYGVVLTDRTRIIQKFIDELLGGGVKFHIRADELDEYIEHWMSMYRVQTEDKMHNPVLRWESSNGVDHFCMASIYWLIASGRAGIQGQTFRNETNILKGAESYFVIDNKIPAMTIKEFIGDEEKDWRYT